MLSTTIEKLGQIRSNQVYSQTDLMLFDDQIASCRCRIYIKNGTYGDHEFTTLEASRTYGTETVKETLTAVIEEALAKFEQFKQEQTR